MADILLNLTRNSTSSTQETVWSNKKPADEPLASFVTKKPKLSSDKGTTPMVIVPLKPIRKQVARIRKKPTENSSITSSVLSSLAAQPLNVTSKTTPAVSVSSPVETKKSAVVKPGVVKSPKKFIKPSENASKSAEDSHDLLSSLPSPAGEQVQSGSTANKVIQPGTFISSLFRKNPSVPTIEKQSVDSTLETLFSSETFHGLDIHDHLKATLEKEMQITEMTSVQKRAIPELLEGKDVLVKSQTGSGKTLSYAIPVVQILQAIRPKTTRADGVFALVVVPTRELVLQTYQIFVKLTKPFTWVVPGYLVGGEKKKSEKARIRKGFNILVCTTGRLLDHLSSTKNLSLHKLQFLIMDEADRLLDMGYEKDVTKIMDIIRGHQGVNRTEMQTALLSATLTAGVEKLAGLAISKQFVTISLSEDTNSNPKILTTPAHLKHYFTFVPPKLRLITLSAFLLHHCGRSKKKACIFVSTQDMVDFHTSLFSEALRAGDTIDYYKLHGNMLQKERTEIFKNFRAAASGVLFCTDVAARGLDFPEVDWIVQYNPPIKAEDYVHRVGRTARLGNEGSALTFLDPVQAGFVRMMGERGVDLVEKSAEEFLETLPQTHSQNGGSMEEVATRLQLKFEELVLGNPDLHQSASKGYVSFVRSYAAFPKEVRQIFNFKELHLGHYAKSFALRDPPTKISGLSRTKSAARNPAARRRGPPMRKPLPGNMKRKTPLPRKKTAH